MQNPAQENILLDVQALKKYFPLHKGFFRQVTGSVKAVDDVHFHVNRGELLSLVGESGCGKTTTARCIMRGYTPTSGKMLFNTKTGDQVDLSTLTSSQLRKIRPEIQMIFQDPVSSLNPRMTVHDIIAEGMEVNHITRPSERTDRIAETMKLVGLRPEYMRRFPHAFSGGERQRIGIARALVLNPSLIIADEPVSALDVSVQAQILNLILDLQTKLNLTMLFVAHDLSVVKHISNRVAVMYVGQIVETAAADALFGSPLHPYTEALLSSAPKSDPLAPSAHIKLQGEIANPANPPSGCYFHPRCAYAKEVCRQNAPLFEEVHPGHWARCHFSRELSLKNIH